MHAKLLVLFVGAVVLVSGLPVATSQQPGSDEPLADRVRTAIDKGVAFLKKTQRTTDGSWESNVNVLGHPGGQTALAVLALLNCGVKADHPDVAKGIAYLRTVKDPGTYVRALQTMVFVEAGLNEDKQRIKENVDQLLRQAQRDNGGGLIGWNYGNGANRADNSNTQYALLGIWVARNSEGVGIDAKFWADVRAMYARMQLPDGGWPYEPEGGERSARLTMTTAGLSGLLMAQMELAAAKQNNDPVAGCGIYPENAPLQRGFSWIYTPPPGGLDRFILKDRGATFYNIYGIERLGRFSGQRFIGPHDWYREGCQWLVDKQMENGSWALSGIWDSNPTVSTSFSLLFLSKGRTPVLISKLAHGKRPRSDNDQDWNRRRNDLRHLVQFASDNVFHKLPLAWQIFDIDRASKPREGQTVADHEREVTSDLLQAPILYMSGHESPINRLTALEKALIKKYVENGGIILAAACCGAPEFDRGFHELCKELWEFNDLTPLEIDHAIWNMRFEVKPGSFKLKGLQMGCKTVVVYSPENLPGYWELNRTTDLAEGEVAFRLGANIIAYATGLDAPKPRLTNVQVAEIVKDQPSAVRRGYFQVGQLIGRVGDEADWVPAPEAMTRLMQNLREVVGLDVVLKTTNVAIDNKNLTDFKFLYMHGRKNFKFTSAQLERLRFNLKNGGLLFADACCGKEAFDKAFRQFIVDLFPKEPGMDDKDVPRLVPIPEKDELYGKELNGEALTAANIQCRLERGKAPQAIHPKLEGVMIGKRWVVIYSQYDIGCALERHQSPECIGYSYESALRLGRAAVLYQFRP